MVKRKKGYHTNQKTLFFKPLLAIAVLLLSTFILSSSITKPVLAKENSICDNKNVSAEVKAAAGCANTSTGTLDNALTIILKGIIFILGVVAVVYIVIGGINYMTSAGDANKIKKARETILYAVIGLIICVLSFLIVNFVIDGLLSGGGGGNEKTETETETEAEVEAYQTTLIQNDIAILKK